MEERHRPVPLVRGEGRAAPARPYIVPQSGKSINF